MTPVSDFSSLQQRYELDVFGKRGIALVRGQDYRVWDEEGRGYIDCIAGQGSANLGHGHPRILGAIQDQASRLIHCPGAFANDQRAQFMEALVKVAPAGLSRVFLCNSGTEAVEAAIKFARIATGRNKVVTATGGFHGRTYGALSATFNPKYRKGCGSLLPGFTHVPYNQVPPLQEAIDGETAGVILEVVQGEGGVHLASQEYLEAARALCDRHGAQLIIDEVQTGFGRTGRMFAIDHFSIRPDIMCLAKSIAAGLPMGAVLTAAHIRIPIGAHGSTFSGNPLACAAALATLKVMEEEELPQRAQWLGDRLQHRLSGQNCPSIREIRRLGLMIGIELKLKVRPVLRELMARGILALAAGGTVLRLLPPLIMDRPGIDQVADTLLEVLGNEKSFT